MKDKVLILGSAGFTGRHFSEFISRNNLKEIYDFVGCDYTISGENDFRIITLDLSVQANVDSLIENEMPDYIINLVGTYSVIDFMQLIKINVGISKSILDICFRSKIPVKNILLLGSAAEYGNCSKMPIYESEKLSPVSIYGLSKVFQTETGMYFFRNMGINVTIARPFNLLGKGLPEFLSVGSFVKQIREAKDNDIISVGNINSRRDFIDISDAVEAYWNLLLFGRPGEIYNVCAGFSYSMEDILNLLIKIHGKKIQIVVKDELIKKNDINDIYGDNSKLKELTDWKPTQLLQSSLVKMF